MSVGDEREVQQLEVRGRPRVLGAVQQRGTAQGFDQSRSYDEELSGSEAFSLERDLWTPESVALEMLTGTGSGSGSFDDDGGGGDGAWVEAGVEAERTGASARGLGASLNRRGSPRAEARPKTRL